MDINKINAVIDSVAARLKVPSQAIWRAAMEHNIACLVSDSVFMLAAMAVFVCGAYLVRIATRRSAAGSSNYVDPGLDVLGGFMVLIGAVLFLGFGQDALLRAIAPHWSAANDLVDALKGN